MFTTYRFDDLSTEQSHYLDGWSHLWAALFGPFYVLAKGFIFSALLMIPISAGLFAGAAAALVVVVGLLDNTLISLVSSVAIPVGAVLAQGAIAIQLVRLGYLRRGWREGY